MLKYGNYYFQIVNLVRPIFIFLLIKAVKKHVRLIIWRTLPGEKVVNEILNILPQTSCVLKPYSCQNNLKKKKKLFPSGRCR
jgi:hypothetical protein